MEICNLWRIGFNPEREYGGGLLGCVSNPRADEEFDDYILRSGGDPNGDDVATDWEFAGGGCWKTHATFPCCDDISTRLPSWLDSSPW